MRVPFVDLSAQYQSIRKEIDGAIANVISETAFISGKYASDFERDFASYAGLKHCIACANGTDSLEILLRVMGVGPGHEVIVPANSWISTSEAVSSVGARVVFTDVDDHYLMDLDDAERKINASTRAIIPVHLYGNAVEMDRVMAIAKKHRLKVLEDCAQSHGATSNGKKAGTFGDCASFSFYPGKNLGAYGDAGAMLTNDDELAENARIIANHGQRSKHNHVMEGRNSRMDGLQAAILGVKLPHLEKWTNQRIAHAGKYNGLIQHPKVIKPQLRDNHRHVFHLYVIRVPDRDGLASYLKERGIDTAVHYPTPLPLLPCYAHMAYSSSDFPVTSAHQSSILSLPMFAELTDEQINYVADSVNAWNA